MFKRLRRKVRDAERLEEILSVLVRKGFGHYLHAARLIHPFTPAPDEPPGPVVLRETLEELGPTFVKLGQILALRPDIIPLAYCEELRKLQDEVDPLPFPVVKGVVEQELGRPLSTVFTRFAHTPLAAASIAQVHTAHLKGHGPVVVKVQRPGVRARFESDLDILAFLARHLDAHHPRLHLPAVVEELRAYTRRELDFHHERRSMERCADFFRERAEVFIPQVFPEHSTARLLVIQQVKGLRVRDRERLAAKLDPRQVASIFYRAMFDQVFTLGLFHADPHPGNLFVIQRPRLTLAFVDFGIVGVLDRSLQQLTRELLIALSERDARRILWVLLRLGTRRAGARPKELQRAITQLLADWREGETRPSILFYRLLRKAMAHGLDFPPDLMLLAKAFITMEGTALFLDPSFSADKEIPRLLRRELTQQRRVENVMRASAKTMKAAQTLVEEGPLVLSAVLDRLEEGRFDLRMDARQFVRAERVYDLEMTKLALALLAAALFIGVSLLLGLSPGPRLAGWPLALWAFFLFAVVFALFIYLSLRARRVVSNEP